MEKTTVLPGDKIRLDESCSIIGPGLRGTGQRGEVRAVNCGLLRQRNENEGDGKRTSAVWLDCDNQRYIPVIGDSVIGQVMQKMGAEGWKVDIGCADLANLSNLSFEGATKKNRPDVKIGDLVFGRVSETIEPEVVCISDDRRARSFGVLPSNGGWLIRSSPSHVRKLLSSQCQLFALLGAKLKFEITCGMNGWIWVKASGLRETVYVAKAIEMSRHLASNQMREMVDKLEKERRDQFLSVS